MSGERPRRDGWGPARRGPGVRVGLVSLLGLPLFVWPFAGRPLPSGTPAVALVAGAVGALLLVEVGTRQLDARRLALLAVLATADTALRLAVVQGIGGFSPFFFLVLCAGYVLGPSYGFLAGGLSMLVSAVAEGGVGPWLPYQVFAAGWVGVAAGLAGLAAGVARGPMRRPDLRDVALLAAAGAVTGWAYGALTDVQVWTAGFQGSAGLGWQPGLGAGAALLRFGRFYLVTSLAYDTFRSAGNALMVLLLGAPVLAALHRARSRLSFEVIRA